MSKYFYVSYEKELADSKALITNIAGDGWVDNFTVIVNCSPDYSSRLTQLVNHKLSYLNNHDLYEVINLEMPYPTMSQVWDAIDKQYYPYEKYIAEWVRRNIITHTKYLFVESGTLRGKNATVVRNALRPRIEPSTYRFASLYLQSDSIFTPDYYLEKFDKEKQGGLLFEWENVNNPNWDY